MKKLLSVLAVSAFLLMSVSSFAQHGKKECPAKHNEKSFVEHLTKELNLTDKQVKDVTAAIEGIKAEQKDGKTCHIEFDKKMQNILSAEQYKQYKEKQAKCPGIKKGEKKPCNKQCDSCSNGHCPKNKNVKSECAKEKCTKGECSKGECAKEKCSKGECSKSECKKETCCKKTGEKQCPANNSCKK